MPPLTAERVVARAKESDFTQIKNFNYWGADLTDVSVISRMVNVEVVVLTVNQVHTLEPFQNLTNLRELYMRNNKIENMQELAYLQGLQELRTFWISQNPCSEKDPNYRLTVINALPQITNLDGTEITSEERADAERLKAKQSFLKKAKKNLSEETSAEEVYRAGSNKRQRAQIKTRSPRNTQNALSPDVSEVELPCVSSKKKRTNLRQQYDERPGRRPRNVETQPDTQVIPHRHKSLSTQRRPYKYSHNADDSDVPELESRSCIPTGRRKGRSKSTPHQPSYQTDGYKTTADQRPNLLTSALGIVPELDMNSLRYLRRAIDSAMDELY